MTDGRYNAPQPPPARKPVTTLRTMRDRRLQLHLSLRDLAGRSGVAVAKVSHIERGRMVATAAELEALSEPLGRRLENRMLPCFEETPA